MATPPYQGANQPTGNGGGWFARLGSFFGGGTPTYAGNGQPSGAVGVLGGGAPAYAPAPVAAPPKDPNGTIAAQAPMCCPLDPVCCPIDPAALAAGQIAIVIPRERLGPSETSIAEMQQ
jgi:hypothetical protein